MLLPTKSAANRSFPITEMNIQILAEGIETSSERDFLLDQGISLMQGNLIAKPAFRSADQVDPAAYDVKRH